MLNSIKFNHNRAAIAFCVVLPLVYFLCRKYFCDTSPPRIYAITSTGKWTGQRAELTRMSHLFRLVPNMFWVIVEDADERSELVGNLLFRTGLSERSVNLYWKSEKINILENMEFVKTFDAKGNPGPMKLVRKDVDECRFAQLNVGLRWVKEQIIEGAEHSIVYFMCENYAYSVELFEEMAKIKRGSVGIWNVGLSGGLNIEGPIVEQNRVIGFNSMLSSSRTFATNIAGFAVSCDLLQDNYVEFNVKAKKHFKENDFLKQLTTVDKLQPLAINQVNVWYTPTYKTSLAFEYELKDLKIIPSDYGVVV